MDIILETTEDWETFAEANQESLEAEYGSLDKAFRHCCDGGLILGGGAAPEFFVIFAM